MGELPKGRRLGIRYYNHLSIVTPIATFVESTPGTDNFAAVYTVGTTYLTLVVHHIVQCTVVPNFYGGGIWNGVFTTQNQGISNGRNYFWCFIVADDKDISVIGNGLAALIGHFKSQPQGIHTWPFKNKNLRRCGCNGNGMATLLRGQGYLELQGIEPGAVGGICVFTGHYGRVFHQTGQREKMVGLPGLSRQSSVKKQAGSQYCEGVNQMLHTKTEVLRFTDTFSILNTVTTISK